MSVFDSLKDSLPGSGSSSSSGSRSGDSDFDSDFGSDFDSPDFDDSFQDNSPRSGQNDLGLDQGDTGQTGFDGPGGQGEGLDSQSPVTGQDGRGSPGEQQRSNPQQNTRGQSRRGTPSQSRTGQQRAKDNPSQTSRPQENRSRNTPHDSPNPQTGRPQRGSAEPQLSRQTEKKMENAGLKDSQDQSVAERSDEFQELKRQNEQIIELLKRINDNLEMSGTGQSGGRHGGRR